MKLIIAEKPSVAKDIAKAIGACEKCSLGARTYYKNDDFMVTNVRGHYISLAMPEDYDEKYSDKRNVNLLPIYPNQFRLLPINEKIGELATLKKLIFSSEVDSLICATDAGREGEVIFGYIYRYLNCKKPYQRLWISSTTSEAIRKGMSNLLPGAEKSMLFNAGFLRAKIDWLIGMNLSRLYSTYYNTNYPVGRVQTVVVNLISKRDTEIQNFVKSKYYKVVMDNGAVNFHSDTEKGEQIANREAAENVIMKCKGKPVTVIKAVTEKCHENRPLLYCLDTLQQDANDIFGYSASTTLSLVQSLYDKHLLSYPRSESEHITSDMIAEIPIIVEKLRFFDSQRVDFITSQGLNLDKRVVDDTKVSDHHAIIPTVDIDTITQSNVNEQEMNIVKLVCNRLLTSLDQPRQYIRTEYVFLVADEQFRLTGSTTINPGWKRYNTKRDEEVELPLYKEGDTFICDNYTILPGETVPPKQYTESLLINDMKHIGKFIDEREMRSFVAERGLGTTATRASIIESVINTGYISREGKKLKSTLKGRQMIMSVPEIIKSPVFTAIIEQQLYDIETGKGDESISMHKTMALINSCIKEEQGKEHENRSLTEREALGLCPKCGSPVYSTAKAYSCKGGAEGCGFTIWKTICEKTLTESAVKSLLSKKKTQLLKGFVSKKGTKFDSYLIIKDDYTIGFEFPQLKNKGK